MRPIRLRNLIVVRNVAYGLGKLAGGAATEQNAVSPSAENVATFLRSLCLRALWVIGALSVMVALVAALPTAEPRGTLRGHTLALGGLAYSADGRYLATGSYDRSAKVWDAATAKELATLV